MTGAESRRRFERALQYGGGTHTVADVSRLIHDNKAQFWQRGEGFIVTELHQYPLLKACNYWIVWGKLPDCLALQDEIDDWARGEGCTVATAMGRKGWARAAPGWKLWYPNFIKSLGGEH